MITALPLFVRHLLEMHAAVGRHRSNSRAAGAEVERDLLRESTLHSHRKIDSYTAVDCSGFEMCGIVFRHRHDHAAVGRADVESFAVPTVTGQFNYEAAIRGRAFHRSADSLQTHAAI